MQLFKQYDRGPQLSTATFFRYYGVNAKIAKDFLVWTRHKLVEKKRFQRRDLDILRGCSISKSKWWLLKQNKRQITSNKLANEMGGKSRKFSGKIFCNRLTVPFYTQYYIVLQYHLIGQSCKVLCSKKVVKISIW